MTSRQRIVVGLGTIALVIGVIVAAVALTGYVEHRSKFDARLASIGDYLVNCTTPTPPPTPEHPKPRVHDCFERGARGQSGAISEIDCRARRMQARLTAPPDPTKPCIDQTPSDVYPGIAGQPPKGP